MEILSWFWAIVGTIGLLYTVTQISSAVPATFALVGWIMLLVWLIIAVIYRQKFVKTTASLEKMKQQNIEFVDGLMETLQSQLEEIRHLREEKRFLMITLENHHDKKESNDKN